ncbi:DUF4113 domain-containing protein [Escherichia coli]|nr:DUF4113 domain-containing protein [Escherichia coli]
MRVLDGINNSGWVKYGLRAGYGPGMADETEMLSPAYTTRWSDIPAAKLA